MLSNLYAKNLALIENLSVDFSSGFSVLTGETGAGKSLILDSMNIFLQNKLGKELIRYGEDSLSVSLFFDEIDDETGRRITEICPELEYKEGLTLSRTISKDGKNSARINLRQMPFSSVREIASLLIKINGQNDAIGLQDRKKHISYLDSAFDDEEKKIFSDYSEKYEEYRSLISEIDELNKKDTSPEALELIEYRIREIEKAKIKPGEEKLLKDKQLEIKSHEKITDAIVYCNKALSGGEKGKGASFLVNAALKKMEGLSEIKSLCPMIEELNEIAERIDNLSFKIAGIAMEENAEREAEILEKITKRLDVIFRASAKYGPTEEDIIKNYEKMKSELETLKSLGSRISELSGKKAQVEKKLSQIADSITAMRKKKANELEKDIAGVLHFLDMPKTVFKVNFTKSEKFLSNGNDEVEFFISTNAGEGFKPLCDIASGGELSRVMLAIQTKFGKAKDSPTVIFDEIDTGISGSTSQKIGVCLKMLGKERQVICVTHSAQVATLGDHHFKVRKSENSGRTTTEIKVLSGEEKFTEVARILSGEKITDEAILNAKELYKQGNRIFENSII